MDKFNDVDKKLQTPAMMDTFKGELVRDPASRQLTASEDILSDNPYKTPPNNLTRKKHSLGEKG
ncbi:hypothetical protein [Zhaonella formicivorans]|uniref:hypothetical protein n=1 Tax=Zhaonella formicivorans TaxID=2528593 RepID=UPI0010F09C93|nr:hypothetical protein [Zhaonella formicivorans]